MGSVHSRFLGSRGSAALPQDFSLIDHQCPNLSLTNPDMLEIVVFHGICLRSSQNCLILFLQILLHLSGQPVHLCGYRCRVQHHCMFEPFQLGRWKIGLRPGGVTAVA